MQKFRARFSFLCMCATVTLVVVACGRASQDDIDHALQITQVPTLSAEQVQQSTQQADIDIKTREAAQALLASPGASGGAVDIAAAGDPALGRTAFNQRCMGCHRAGGLGPVLSGANGPIAGMTDQQVVDLIRTGNGHATPPGPLSTTDISETQMTNLIAYLRQQAK
jgi:mono/diheme cytochrome c family protein